MIAVFHHFSTYLWLSWFSFTFNRIFQVHDMTINFSFSCSFLFFFHDLSTPNNDACHKWPSQLKASFLIWELFWKGWLLVRSCSYHFCPREKYDSKVFPRNGQFLVDVPWGINQGDFRALWSWDLCFWSLKRFGRFEAVASLDAYQITNYQFPSKTHHHFLLPDFWRIRKEVSKSRILWPIT